MGSLQKKGAGWSLLLLHKLHPRRAWKLLLWTWAGHLDPASAGGQPTASEREELRRGLILTCAAGRLCKIDARGRWKWKALTSSRSGSLLLCIGRALVGTHAITLVSVRGCDLASTPAPSTESDTRRPRLAAPQNWPSPRHTYPVFAVGLDRSRRSRGTTKLQKQAPQVPPSPGPTDRTVPPVPRTVQASERRRPPPRKYRASPDPTFRPSSSGAGATLACPAPITNPAEGSTSRARLPANTGQGFQSQSGQRPLSWAPRRLGCLAGFADTRRRCDPSSRPDFAFLSGVIVLSTGYITRRTKSPSHVPRVHASPHTPLQGPPRIPDRNPPAGRCRLPKQPATIRSPVINVLPSTQALSPPPRKQLSPAAPYGRTRASEISNSPRVSSPSPPPPVHASPPCEADPRGRARPPARSAPSHVTRRRRAPSRVSSLAPDLTHACALQGHKY